MNADGDYVIDTNVWVIARRDLSQIQDLKELACAEAALDWISRFMAGTARLVVDWRYEILGEYRRNADRVIDEWLNNLERQPRTRLIEVEVLWEDDTLAPRIAKLPPEFTIPDANDRKFLAVLLKHREQNPQARLVNACDTDWAIACEQSVLLAALVLELCPDYIAAIRAQA